MNPMLPKLSNEDKQWIIKRSYLDIDYFAHYFLKDTVYDETPWFHKEVYNYLERDDIQKLAIIVPRGHAKSTLSSKIYVLHRILFAAYTDTRFIIMVSESLDQSVNLLKDVSEEFRYNDLIREFFGDLVGNGKWTEADIVTSNGVRVWARGSRQRIRGSKFRNRRPDLIILDDFESELNTETPEQRDKLKKWINAAVLPAVDPKLGKVFLIGTIIHEDAYLADIKNDKDGLLGWQKRMYKAGLPEGEALWEARYPIKKLQKIHDELAAQGYEHIYYQEYENEAVTPGSGLAREIIVTKFDYVWIDDADCWFIETEKNVWLAMFTFLGYDPALGKMKGDATGEIVLGVDSNGHNHVLQVEEVRCGVFELLERMFDQVKAWHVRNLNIESISFQEVLRDALYQMMPMKGIYFGVIDYKPKDKKATRLQGLTPYYYGGNISHNGNYPNLTSQLRMFPKTKHDDLLDALWMVLQGCSKPQTMDYTPGKPMGKKKKGGRVFKKYSWLTGAPVEN
ncbi:MAG: hypothetical protein KAQ85_07435 [Thermodesulfovibrionia bacterium]|nr:hypothetical protein [Thermodesulfovibrionia bacterium]